MEVDPPPTPCDQTCVPRAPSGWTGPTAFWEGTPPVPPAGAPKCPAGFADPLPTDAHRGLVAPAGSCPCKCGPAQGQVCDTTLHIYPDQACSTQCASGGTRTCTTLPATCNGSQGTSDIDALIVSGGACEPHVDLPAPPTWQFDDRLCKSSDQGSCENPDQVCARTPDSPYLSYLCVTRTIGVGDAIPACPAGYKTAKGPLYGTAIDNRGCSTCTCGAPSGGTCTGKITIYSGADCNLTSPAEYVLSTSTAPTPRCQSFDLGAGSLRPTLIQGHYTVTPPGMCSVSTKSMPTGEATLGGQVTVVCCQ